MTRAAEVWRRGKPGWWWTALAVHSAIIFTLSSIVFDDDTPGVKVPGFDKLAHIATYAVWAGFFLVAFGRTARSLGFAWVGGWSVVATLAYGVTDEVHQSFVPGRISDPLDLIADTVGGLIAVGLAVSWLRFARGRDKV